MNYIYLISIEENVKPKRMKIGITSTSRLIERVRNLQTASPYRLVLERTILANNGMVTEKQIHEHMKQFRKSGEWFDDTRESRKKLGELGGLFW